MRTIELALQTKGHTDIPDLTDEAACAVGASGLKEGQGTVFAPSSTSGLRPLEYKPGAVADLKRAPDEMAPANREYQLNLKRGDGNGAAYVREALAVTVPVIK